MNPCNRCESHGLGFSGREYGPEEFLVGRTDSVIWIVGLNPKLEDTMPILHTSEALSTYFDDKDREGSKVSRYFHDFKKVSTLWDKLGEPNGAAHVDLVACSSTSFPPNNVPWSVAEEIIAKCEVNLKAQIEMRKPKILICNGRPTSNHIVKLFPPPERSGGSPVSYTTWEAGKQLCTSYMTRFPTGEEMAVVLSGFIGRIDDYAKRRLGAEIESYMREMNVNGVGIPAASDRYQRYLSTPGRLQ